MLISGFAPRFFRTTECFPTRESSIYALTAHEFELGRIRALEGNRRGLGGRGYPIPSSKKMIRWDRGNYAETSKQKEVNPRDLRFTQRTIGNRFKAPYEGVRLTQVVEEIEKGVQEPSVLYQSPLKVCEDENGIMWCENNRRLWVLRKAGVSSVRVKLKSNGYKARCLGTDQETMRDPEFYPELRGEETCNPGVGMDIGDGSLSHAEPPQYTSGEQRSVPAHLVTDFKLHRNSISFTFEILGTCSVFAALVACFVALFMHFDGCRR